MIAGPYGTQDCTSCPGVGSNACHIQRPENKGLLTKIRLRLKWQHPVERTSKSMANMTQQLPQSALYPAKWAYFCPNFAQNPKIWRLL